MNISYYTIDDLRLPPKRSLRRGRSVEQYSTLEEALARYQSLPAAGIRVLGLTDGIHVLELVKCLPLFPDDQEGENVLALDYGCFPLWAQEPEAANATHICITAMGLRYPRSFSRSRPASTAHPKSASKRNSSFRSLARSGGEL